MATVEFYSKAQVDAKIPSAAQLVPTTSGATSGDVLTFDGSSVGWAAGGGGGSSGWEEIDLSNLPTDFANTDELMILLKVKPFLSGTPATWTTAINASNLSLDDATYAEYPTPILHVKSNGVYGCKFGIFDNGTNSIMYYALGMNLVFKQTENLNGTSNWLALYAFAFNGSNFVQTSATNVKRSNITTYIDKMYRKK